MRDEPSLFEPADQEEPRHLRIAREFTAPLGPIPASYPLTQEQMTALLAQVNEEIRAQNHAEMALGWMIASARAEQLRYQRAKADFIRSRFPEELLGVCRERNIQPEVNPKFFRLAPGLFDNPLVRRIMRKAQVTNDDLHARVVQKHLHDLKAFEDLIAAAFKNEAKAQRLLRDMRSGRKRKVVLEGVDYERL